MIANGGGAIDDDSGNGNGGYGGGGRIFINFTSWSDTEP